MLSLAASEPVPRAHAVGMRTGSVFDPYTESKRKSVEKMKARHFDMNSDGLDHLDAEFLHDVLIMKCDKRDLPTREDRPRCSPSMDPKYNLASGSFPPSASTVVTDCSYDDHQLNSRRNDTTRNEPVETAGFNPFHKTFTTSEARNGDKPHENSHSHGYAPSGDMSRRRSSSGTSNTVSSKFSFSSHRDHSKSSKRDEDWGNGESQTRHRLHSSIRKDVTSTSAVRSRGSKEQNQKYASDEATQYPMYPGSGPYHGAYSQCMSRNPRARPTNPSNGGAYHAATPAPCQPGMHRNVYGSMHPPVPPKNQGPYSKLMQDKKDGTPLVNGPSSNQGPYSVLVKNTHYTPKLQLPAWIGPNDVLQGDSEMGLSVFSNYCKCLA